MTMFLLLAALGAAIAALGVERAMRHGRGENCNFYGMRRTRNLFL
jgi:hypothetical protein